MNRVCSFACKSFCFCVSLSSSDWITVSLQVLGYDANNVKALYRRGQAYRELGQLEVSLFVHSLQLVVVVVGFRCLLFDKISNDSLIYVRVLYLI